MLSRGSEEYCEPVHGSDNLLQFIGTNCGVVGSVVKVARFNSVTRRWSRTDDHDKPACSLQSHDSQ